MGDRTRWGLRYDGKSHDRVVAYSPHPTPLNEGDIELGIDTLALSGNTATYSRLHDCPIPYRTYFTDGEGAHLPPSWGHATVLTSRHPKVAPGQPYFGFLPMASHHVMTVDADDRGLVDLSPAHASMHPWYRRYLTSTTSDLETQARQATLWPVFPAGFHLSRFLPTLPGGIDGVLLTSASSKTATILAWMLNQADAIPVTGLTSRQNVDHVRRLGLYKQVLPYDEIGAVDLTGRTAFVDFTGDPQLLSSTLRPVADQIIHTALVGYTRPGALVHHTDLPGPTPEVFFTPAVEDSVINELGEQEFQHIYTQYRDAFVQWSTRHIATALVSPVDGVTAFRDLMDAGPAPQACQALVLSH